MKQNSNTIWVGLTFLALGLLVGLLAKDLLSGKTPNQVEMTLNQDAAPALAQEGSIVDVSADDDAVLGDKNAPVTIVEFSDYQCPYCADFETGAFPLIKQNYIDTGKVKFVYRDLPLNGRHPQASMAAQAAECVGEEGDDLYYKMHDLLFETLSDWSGNPLAKDVFVSLANDLGVDIQACLDNETMLSEVTDDQTAALSYGVRSTPSFFINGLYVKGARDYEVFQQVIDRFLKDNQ